MQAQGLSEEHVVCAAKSPEKNVEPAQACSSAVLAWRLIHLLITYKTNLPACVTGNSHSPMPCTLH